MRFKFANVFEWFFSMFSQLGLDDTKIFPDVKDCLLIKQLKHLSDP